MKAGWGTKEGTEGKERHARSAARRPSVSDQCAHPVCPLARMHELIDETAARALGADACGHDASRRASARRRREEEEVWRVTEERGEGRKGNDEEGKEGERRKKEHDIPICKSRWTTIDEALRICASVMQRRMGVGRLAAAWIQIEREADTAVGEDSRKRRRARERRPPWRARRTAAASTWSGRAARSHAHVQSLGRSGWASSGASAGGRAIVKHSRKPWEEHRPPREAPIASCLRWSLRFSAAPRSVDLEGSRRTRAGVDGSWTAANPHERTACSGAGARDRRTRRTVERGVGTMPRARAKGSNSAFALSWALADMADAAKRRARRYMTASDGHRMAEEDGAMDVDVSVGVEACRTRRTRGSRGRSASSAWITSGMARADPDYGWAGGWCGVRVASVRHTRAAASAASAMLAQGFGGRACCTSRRWASSVRLTAMIAYPAAVRSRAHAALIPTKLRTVHRINVEKGNECRHAALEERIHQKAVDGASASSPHDQKEEKRTWRASSYNGSGNRDGAIVVVSSAFMRILSAFGASEIQDRQAIAFFLDGTDAQKAVVEITERQTHKAWWWKKRR
ncbi:hypothetical protein C8R45DRAFT_1157162 [Mycena sanguinolenta]|nr:hypothetical protein C8R45DRAFT_1157162 [Mycena sanguinolenta]